VNLDFYNHFSEYLIKECKLSSDGRNVQVFKLIMNEAVDLGYTKNPAHRSKRFITLREESESIYLDKTEFGRCVPQLNDYSEIPWPPSRAASNQKMNDSLKEIGQKVESLKVPDTKFFTKEGKRQQRKYEKWELMTSHTARRSFATNEYLAGTLTLLWRSLVTKQNAHFFDIST
jgi:hypothetical protein